jgi:hypothetical protein
MKKKSYRLLPIAFLFIIAVITNIYLSNKEVITDDTVSKMIEDEIFNRNKQTREIFNNPLDYNDFYLLFDEQKINTNNFINTFNFFSNELKIKKIYPYIEPQYEEYLYHYIGEITFLNDDINSGLNTFIEKYINILSDYGFENEINKINLYGVDIRVVLVNCSNASMQKFLTKYNNIKYSTSLTGVYHKITIE